MRLIAATRARLSDEDGFTMMAVMGAMFVVMLISVAAIAAANGDTHLTRYDQDDKQAYAAAEAGVNDYLGHLNTDNSYWSKCTGVEAPTPVNQIGATATSNPARKWRTLPGSNSRYSIELVPAPGYSACSTTNATASMVNDGNIKIRVTGNVNSTNNYRTINATFRRSGFLDYLWYTKYENQDPAYIKRTVFDGKMTRSTNSSGTVDNPPGERLDQWASRACNLYYWGAGGRRTESWTGEYQNTDGSWSSPFTINTSYVCGEIQFISGDQIRGPFHSNDDILLCGSPTFGTTGGSDRVEVSGPGSGGNGYRSSCGGSAPTFNPSLLNNASTLDPPASNASLKQLTDSPYSFTGPTKIVLNNASMTVTNPNVNGGAPQAMAWPDAGIVYVSNGSSCSTGYDPTDSEATFGPSNTCGDVHLSGTYSKDLTIAADNDVVVTGNVQKATNTDALLGLIPNGFARIWHPVTTLGSNCATDAQSPKNVRVDAAILTLSGSFTVDNYWCGGALGTLTVNGALAQTHRGVVGTGSGGSAATGYIKDYNYNPTLRYRSPPHFLDPLQSSWRTLRQGEQSPPARG